MPTADELRSKEFGVNTDIVTAIYSYHGGLSALAGKMDFPTARSVPRKKKWEDIKDTLRVLSPVCRKLKRMPTAEEFRSGAYGIDRGLINAIYKHHGGLTALAEKMRVPMARSKRRRHRGST